MESRSWGSALSKRNSTSKAENKRPTKSEEKGKNESLADTIFENDALRMRIKTIQKSNETELARLTSFKNEEINALQVINEDLDNTIGDQENKIRQLDTSNIRKDFKIEGMVKRMEELSEQKDKLEQKLLEMKERDNKSKEEKASQGKQIHKLESQVEEVRKELKLIGEQKEKQEKMFETYMKNAQEKQTEQLQIMVKQTMAETMKETMKEGFAELLSKMEPRKDLQEPRKDLQEPRKELQAVASCPDFQTNEVNGVQNTVDSANGKNVVEQTPSLPSNRRALKPTKFNMQLLK